MSASALANSPRTPRGAASLHAWRPSRLLRPTRTRFARAVDSIRPLSRVDTARHPPAARSGSSRCTRRRGRRRRTCSAARGRRRCAECVARRVRATDARCLRARPGTDRAWSHRCPRLAPTCCRARRRARPRGWSARLRWICSQSPKSPWREPIRDVRCDECAQASSLADHRIRRARLAVCDWDRVRRWVGWWCRGLRLAGSLHPHRPRASPRRRVRRPP
jgi:hypothetical protein